MASGLWGGFIERAAPKQASENEKELDKHWREESHVGRHSGKEPGVRGGGRRVRNSARGDEAENRALTECFSGKASKSQVMPDWGSLITFGCCPVNTAALDSD